MYNINVSGKVLITNPFNWGKKFYKGDTLKTDEEIRDYYVWGKHIQL